MTRSTVPLRQSPLVAMPTSLPHINRRRFLAGSLAIGAGAFLPQWLAAAEAKVDPDLFVLMGDTHLMAREEASHRNVKPAEGFRQATAEILSLPTRPSGLIIAGDSAEGNRGGYDTFREVIKPFQKAGMPLRIAFGNHDNRDKFQAAFPKVKFLPIGEEQGKPPSKLVWIWETPQANWFLLDSAILPGISAGKFGEAQLTWLAKSLDA
jgi:3',5'-cyclic-AMP phosphodiesterase